VSWRQKIYQVLEREGPRSTTVSLLHQGLVWLILLNVCTSVLSTVPSVDAANGKMFVLIEHCSLVLFSIEYLVRLWTAPESPMRTTQSAWRWRLRWLTGASALIDLAAILPFVLDQLIDVDLRVIVLLRLLRFFKIARYSPGFQSLLEAIRLERHALVACVIILASVILISAGFMHVLEHEAQPDKFGSIPEAIWWAIATVTTVGYGDVVPVTTGGRVVGSITMVAGLLLLALPASIVATAFAGIISKYHFVATGSLVARMPFFAGLDAGVLIKLLPSIGTRSYGAGEYIVRAGENVTSLYLIAEGMVTLQRGRHRHQLGPGDVFAGGPRPARKAVRAASRVNVLIVESLEASWLLATFPEVAQRITELL